MKETAIQNPARTSLMRAINIILRSTLLAAVIAIGGEAVARELTEAEKAGLAEAVTSFDTAMRDGDVEAIVGVLPDKVFEHLAAQNGLTTEALMTEVISQTEEIMASVTFESFSMDLEKAVYKETPDGTPFALIPTETVMAMGEAGKMKARSDTFAMLDEGDWYLIRTDDAATLTIIKELYPAFSAEEFPAGTMEIVE